MFERLLRFASTRVGTFALSVFLALLIMRAYRAFVPAISERGQAGALAYRSMASHDVDALAFVNAAGLRMQLYLLRPALLGVDVWGVGDKATYTYSSIGKESPAPGGPVDGSRVEFSVVGTSQLEHAIVRQLSAREDAWWLRIRGLSSFRHEPVEQYALVVPDDMRPSRRTPFFTHQSGYFPMFDRAFDLSRCEPASLEPLEPETLVTPAGTFECDRFRVVLRDTVLELWSSPEAGPLGIVRLRSDLEELELVERVTGSEPELDRVIAPLVEGSASYVLGCMSCHYNPMDPHSVSDPR